MTDDGSNVVFQYSDYEKIETHLDFSRTMFLIDKKGRHILKEFDEKKYERKKRSGTNVFTEEITKIYNNLVAILNVNRFSPRLYISLQHNMEEILFKEVHTYGKFYIEDEEYELTRLYFDQSSWIKNQEIQCFELDKGPVLDATEAMCLVCFLKEYEDFVFSIEEYVRDTVDERLKSEVSKITRRLRFKLRVVWDVVVDVINKSFLSVSSIA